MGALYQVSPRRHGPGPRQGALPGLPPLFFPTTFSDVVSGVDERACGAHSHAAWPASFPQATSFHAFPSPLGLTDPPRFHSGSPAFTPAMSCALHTPPIAKHP